jgi:hypothetical protein
MRVPAKECDKERARNPGKAHIRREGPTEPLDLTALHEGPIRNLGKPRSPEQPEILPVQPRVAPRGPYQPFVGSTHKPERLCIGPSA